MISKKINVLIVSDGKRGHEKQSECLVQALQKFLNIQHYKQKPSLLKLLTNRMYSLFKKNIYAKNYDLIIGAGHQTHLSMILSKIFYGGRTVVIMNPSLPLSWFDLCLIPRHDGVNEKSGVILTDGALNNILNEKKHIHRRALIVIGGESKHIKWNNDYVAKKVDEILKQFPAMRFKIVTSRRTPKDFVEFLNKSLKTDIPIIEYSKVDKYWFTEEIKLSEHCWVTEDSISMIYELIAAGCNVYPISLENKYSTKISIEISRLINDGMISTYEYKRKKIQSMKYKNQAQHCASFIFNEWFSE